MANMSYCRFQNTLGDLRDCADALDEGVLHDGNLGEEEQQAAERLVALCAFIATEHGGGE